jgi:hypothetical protein
VKGRLAQIDADRRDVHAMILQCMLLLFDHPTSRLIEAADHLINRVLGSDRAGFKLPVAKVEFGPRSVATRDQGNLIP